MGQKLGRSSAPFFGEGLIPHLTQSRLGWVLPIYQVADTATTARTMTARTTTAINDIGIWHNRTTSAVVTQLHNAVCWDLELPAYIWRMDLAYCCSNDNIAYAGGILQAWRLSEWDDVLLALTKLLHSCHLSHWNEVKQKLTTFLTTEIATDWLQVWSIVIFLVTDNMSQLFM